MYMNTQTYELKSVLDCSDVPTNFCVLDDAIAPAIRLLNVHGYTTAFCCAGHFNESYLPPIAYIQFAFGGITPEQLPDGWIYAHDGQMEHVFAARSPESFNEELSTTMDLLATWAQRLPFV